MIQLIILKLRSTSSKLILTNVYGYNHVLTTLKITNIILKDLLRTSWILHVI